MALKPDRITYGVTNLLAGSDLMVLDYTLENERRTQCRLIMRAIGERRRGSAAAVEAEKAPFGTYSKSAG